MPSKLPDLDSLAPAAVRTVLPAWVASHVAPEGEVSEAVREAARAALEAQDDAALAAGLADFAVLGGAYTLYPASPLGRALSRAVMAALLPQGTADGIEHLIAADAAGPCLLVGNHLSYIDTQVTDMLLARAGAAAVADRLVVVAGPKVYATPFRRLAALGLNTLKTAQSTRLAHTRDGPGPREVARIAIETIRQADRCMASGQPVLLYGEGSRARDGRLGSFLRATRKYARLSGLRLVPVALWGTDAVFPIDTARLHRAAVGVRIGSPVVTSTLGIDAALDAVWEQLAAALPPRNQPQPTREIAPAT